MLHCKGLCTLLRSDWMTWDDCFIVDLLLHQNLHHDTSLVHDKGRKKPLEIPTWGHSISLMMFLLIESEPPAESHLTWSCCKSACCCWRGWTAASWTDCHFPDTGTCSPGTAAPKTYWRRRAASRSGSHVLIALGDRTQTAVSMCAVCTSTHMHTVYIYSQRKAADGSGLAPSPYRHKPAFFTPSHTALHPPTQAKPAQIPKLTPPPPNPSSPNLNHCLPNPAPQGNPNPSIPNQVIRICHFWLRTQHSLQLLPQALSFIPCLLSMTHESVP